MYLTQCVPLQTVGSVMIMIPAYARSVMMVILATVVIRAMVRTEYVLFTDLLLISTRS